ncbi:hypothetical protein DFO57_11192 [Pantoea sp. AG702]|nr:hypothetical protein DFO57_11192 [Pantoea sp. AG702]
MLLLSSCQPMISNVSSWHRADMLTELEVLYERQEDLVHFRAVFFVIEKLLLPSKCLSTASCQHLLKSYADLSDYLYEY